MSRLNQFFQPLPKPEEGVVIIKRESLRVRGILAIAVVAIVVSTISAWLAFLLQKAGLLETGIFVVNGLLIAVVPAFLYLNYLIIAHFPLKYVLDAFTIQRLPPRFGIVGSAWPREIAIGLPRERYPILDRIELHHLASIRIRRHGLFSQLFQAGHVLLQPSPAAKPLVIPYVLHPGTTLSEIAHRHEYLEARGFSALSEEERAPFSRRVIWAGVPLLLIRAGLFSLIAWTLANLWVMFRLAELSSPQQMELIALGLTSLMAILVAYTLFVFIEWWYTVYLITRHRVIFRKGLINVTRQDLPLDEVTTANAQKGAIGQLLDVGDVSVETAGFTSNLRMRNISDPDGVRDLILELQRRQQRQTQTLEVRQISQRLQSLLHLS